MRRLPLLWMRVFPHIKILNNIRYYNSLNLEDIPEVSTSQIKRTLKAHGVAFEDGFTCLILECPLCELPGKVPKTNPRVFINKTTGYFMCPTCNYSSQWNNIERFFGPQKNSRYKKDLELLREEIMSGRGYVSVAWRDVISSTDPLSVLNEAEKEQLMVKFSFTMISAAVLLQFDCYVDKPRQRLYFPLLNNESLVVGYKVLDSVSGSERTVPSAGCSGLLVPNIRPQKSLGKDTTAVIVSTVPDLLALCSQKMSAVPICLPHGRATLPQEVLPALERYKQLVLWFPCDTYSWDSARNFAKKLDEKRCLFVRPTDQQPEAHDALLQGHDLRNIISSAQPIWHKAITCFSALRQDVLSDLQNMDKVAGVKWSRYPVLNRIMKGHRRGELTVLTGPTGCGKTTFMSEYSLDLASQGVNTLWGSFEIRNARLARAMLQQFAGLPLDDHLEVFDQWADRFEQLPIYFLTFHGQQSVKVVMEAVEHATYVHDISHVIIDNVQFMMGMSDESRISDRFWKQDSVVAAFRTFATRKNCHVTLVIHPRKERDSEDLTTSSIFGGAKASQEADNVFIIQDKRLTSLRGKKYLQIAKNRYSGDLGVMPLEFDKDSLSYATKKRQKPSESPVVKEQTHSQEIEGAIAPNNKID